MKKLLLFAVLLWPSLASAQAGLPQYSIPIAPGLGAVGWFAGGPCSIGQTLIWASGAGALPSCGTPAAGAIISGTTPIGNNTPNGILYGDSSGTLQQVSPTNNGVLIYGSGGIPGSSTTLPAAVQSNITGVGVLVSGSTGAGFTINFTLATISGILSPTHGGTGINNGSNTITTAAPLTFSGTGAATFIWGSSPVSYTFPTATDTLAGLSSSQTFSGNNIFSGTSTFNGTVSGTGITSLFASPPPVGSTSRNTGAFTSLLLTTALSIANGGTGATTAQAARAQAALNIDELTIVGNINYSILSTDRSVAHSLMSHPLVDTLPPANSVNPGQDIELRDQYGQANATNTITLAPAGSDTLNGTTGIVVINSTYGGVIVKSDGISAWSFVPNTGGGGGGSGTVTSVSCARGAICSTFTTSGTVAAPAALLTPATLTGSL